MRIFTAEDAEVADKSVASNSCGCGARFIKRWTLNITSASRTTDRRNTYPAVSTVRIMPRPREVKGLIVDNANGRFGLYQLSHPGRPLPLHHRPEYIES